MTKLDTEVKVLRKKTAKHIIKYREEAGLTPKQVAKKSGVPYRQYLRIESGEHDYFLRYLFAIGSVLGFTLKLKLVKRRGEK